MLKLLVERRIYPALLAISVITSLVVMQIMQFTRLYEHIKNDKYLVGKRLVNYYHSHSKPSEPPMQTTSTQEPSIQHRQLPQDENPPHPPDEEIPLGQDGLPVPLPPPLNPPEVDLELPDLVR